MLLWNYLSNSDNMFVFTLTKTLLSDSKLYVYTISFDLNLTVFDLSVSSTC